MPAFLDILDDEVHAVLAQQIDRLNLLSDEAQPCRFPRSSLVDGELRELRCHYYGRQRDRILWFASDFVAEDRQLVLLHIFSKRTAKIPASENTLTQQGWDDLKNSRARPEPSICREPEEPPPIIMSICPPISAVAQSF